MDAHNSLDSVLGVPVMCLLDWIDVCRIAEYITCLKYVSIFLQFVWRSVPLYNIISMCLLSSVIISQYLFSNTTLLVLSSITDNTSKLKASTSSFSFPGLSIFYLIFQLLYPSYPDNTEAYLQMYIHLEARLFCWLFPLYQFTFNYLYAGLTITWNSSYRFTTNSKEWITVDVVVTTNT